MNSPRAISDVGRDLLRTATFVDEIGHSVSHAKNLPWVSCEIKRLLTLGKLTFGRLRDMEDGSWIELREPYERLKWARKRWQSKQGIKPTGKAAAESLGMKEDTYTAYEREPGTSKHTALDHQKAVQFARKFKVNWVWLLTGDESPFERSAAQSRAIAAMAAAGEDDQELAADLIEVALKQRA